MNLDTNLAESPVLETVETIQDVFDLIVYNDDINTFEHVIQALVDICGHEHIQAEQCTLLIHYKGKCTVKIGDFDTLASMRQGICDRGIWAEVK